MSAKPITGRRPPTYTIDGLTGETFHSFVGSLVAANQIARIERRSALIRRNGQIFWIAPKRRIYQ